MHKVTIIDIHINNYFSKKKFNKKNKLWKVLIN